MEHAGIAYTLRLGQNIAAATTNQGDQLACCHSAASNETILERLGYALAEIALGKEVGDQGDTAVFEIEETPWAGVLYADAVQYCLSFRTEGLQDLEGFYKAVVKPCVLLFYGLLSFTYSSRMHSIYNEIVANRYHALHPQHQQQAVTPQAQTS